MDDSRTAALTAKKTYTDAEYKHRDEVLDFVFNSDLVTQAAIREFRKRKIGNTEYAVNTLNNLGMKMNTRSLNTAQMELARNILRSHQNDLIAIFGAEVKAKASRGEKKVVVQATSAPVQADTSLNESPDDSDIGF